MIMHVVLAMCLGAFACGAAVVFGWLTWTTFTDPAVIHMMMAPLHTWQGLVTIGPLLAFLAFSVLWLMFTGLVLLIGRLRS